MSKKPSKGAPKKPSIEVKPAEPEAAEPALQHLHDPEKRPLKVPVGGVPANLPKQFPGKGPKNFNQNMGKGRNFRHQGR